MHTCIYIFTCVILYVMYVTNMYIYIGVVYDISVALLSVAHHACIPFTHICLCSAHCRILCTSQIYICVGVFYGIGAALYAAAGDGCGYPIIADVIIFRFFICSAILKFIYFFLLARKRYFLHRKN